MRVQAAVLVFITVIAVPAAAQWNVGFEINATHYRGSSGAANESSGPTTVRPANATTFGVRVDRAIGGGRARLGLQVSYANLGLTAAAPGAHGTRTGLAPRSHPPPKKGPRDAPLLPGPVEPRGCRWGGGFQPGGAPPAAPPPARKPPNPPAPWARPRPPPRRPPATR